MSDPNVPDEPQSPLSYRNAADDREPSAGRKVAGGVFTGGFVTAAVGIILYCGTFEVPPRGPSVPRHHLPQTALFAAAAVASAVTLCWPGSGPRRRSYLLGLLVGVLVMSLVEGTCFFNP